MHVCGGMKFPPCSSLVRAAHLQKSREMRSTYKRVMERMNAPRDTQILLYLLLYLCSISDADSLWSTGWRRHVGCLLCSGHFPQKSSIICGLFCGKRPANWGILCAFGTLQDMGTHGCMQRVTNECNESRTSQVPFVRTHKWMQRVTNACNESRTSQIPHVNKSWMHQVDRTKTPPAGFPIYYVP